MEVLMSFDSRPMRSGHTFAWRSTTMLLRSIVLSVRQASKYGRVRFYADSFVAEALRLLPIDLDIVPFFDKKEYRQELFGACKLMVYREQDKPFMHVDFDSYLFNVDFMLDAPVGVVYPGNVGMNVVNKADELGIVKTRAISVEPDAIYNTGLFVCNDMDFHADYVEGAFEFLDANIDSFNAIPASRMTVINAVVDEYTASCVMKLRGITPRMMYPHMHDCNWKSGYVHLLGGLKTIYENDLALSMLVKDDITEAVQFWKKEMQDGSRNV